MRATLLYCLVFCSSCWLVGCGDDDPLPMDGGDHVDAGGTDAGALDSGASDGGVVDGGSTGCTEGCEWVEVAAGFNHTCARRANGSIKCWGGNVHGEVGDGNERHMDCGSAGSTEVQDCAPPVTVRVVNDATQISSRGGLSACALREGGDVFCWGLQSVPPSIGSDAMPRRFTPELRDGFTAMSQVSDGFGHTCAVGAGAGVVSCIGRNRSGQIGNNDTMEVRVITPLAMPTGFVEVQVATASDFTCGRTADAVYCWGSNADGQLGDGVVDHPDNCETGGAVADYDCSLTPIAVTVPTDVTFTALTLGSAHACALSDAGTVYCWGANNFGQLGVEDNIFRGVPTEVPGLSGVAQISAGDNFTCALATDGAVWCWGDNEEGTVGDGSMTHVGCISPTSTDCASSPVQVMMIDDATHIASGFQHACAVRADGAEVWCWGWNNKKQLGDTTRERRNVPVQVVSLD